MKKNLIISIIVLFSTVFVLSGTFYGTSKAVKQLNTNAREFTEYNETKKYALLIGGGTTQHDTCESYYKNIKYFANTLEKLSYDDNDVKILFSGGRTQDHPIVEGDATKTSVMNELNYFKKNIDSNDTLIIFRSGHGIVELIFEKYGILSNDERVPETDNIKILGTAAVMLFSDGSLSYLEFQKKLEEIKGKQIVVILNQCFSGQFTNMAMTLDHTVIISETNELEIAFQRSKIEKNSEHNVWPFVKCICDGFLKNGNGEKKQSVFNAFQYMLTCNPNVKGIRIKEARPLWKESPQIKYGSGLIKGSVFIN